MKSARLLVVTLGLLLATRGASEDGAPGAEAPASGEPTLLASASLLPSHAPAAPAATPSADERVAMRLAPRPDDLAAVLPPPPQRVTLDNSYGAVTVTHAAHLARRITCKACHGPGPVQKIGRFQPRQAHDACRACHVQLAKGPTACQGCHVKRAPPPEPVLALDARRPGGPPAPVAGPPGFAGPPGSGPGAFDPVAAATAFETAAAWPARPGAGGAVGPDGAPASGVAPPSARRTAYAGASVVTATRAPAAPGISLRVSSEQGGWEIAESFEFASGGGARRAIGLVGAGVVLPIRGRWSAHLLGVGGFDAADARWATFLPALGARAGVAWAGSSRVVQSLDVSVTALADAMRARDPSGRTVSGAVMSIGVSAGFGLDRR